MTLIRAVCRSLSTGQTLSTKKMSARLSWLNKTPYINLPARIKFLHRGLGAPLQRSRSIPIRRHAVAYGTSRRRHMTKAELNIEDLSQQNFPQFLFMG